MKKIITTAIFGLFIICLQAQWTEKAPAIKGNGVVISEERTVNTFSQLEVSGAVDVYIYSSNAHRVEITSDENIMEYISTEVLGGKLFVKTEANIKKYEQLMVMIYTPSFTDLTVSGASDLWVKDEFTTKVMNINASGASNLTLDNINAESIFIEATGAADMEISGLCKNLTISASGSSDIVAHKLQSETCDITGSGASDISAFASQVLNAELSGSTDLEYTGNPTTRNINTSAASDADEMD